MTPEVESLLFGSAASRARAKDGTWHVPGAADTGEEEQG